MTTRYLNDLLIERWSDIRKSVILAWIIQIHIEVIDLACRSKEMPEKALFIYKKINFLCSKFSNISRHDLYEISSKLLYKKYSKTQLFQNWKFRTCHAELTKSDKKWLPVVPGISLTVNFTLEFHYKSSEWIMKKLYLKSVKS